jgi:6-pyruvoyl tetrahydropterin synthase/QueD family protein
MYYVKKTLEISAAHRLTLDYESKCTALHGHNWIITVFCRSAELDQNGMVVDFSLIKSKVKRCCVWQRVMMLFSLRLILLAFVLRRTIISNVI